LKKIASARKARTISNPPAIPSVVVVGSVAQDIIHTPFTSSGLVLGGSAVHFSNAASFFTSVGMVGVVGDDYPLKDLDFLRKRKVDLSGVDVKPGPSFLWEGRYLENFLSRETIRTELGVFADFKPNLPQHYRSPKILFLAAIHPQLQQQVLNQVHRPNMVAIDTFKLWIDVAKPEFLKVLKRSDLFFANDDEVRWLTGEHNLFKGAQALRKMGPKWIIVKKGEHGSFLMGEQGIFLSNTYPISDVVDPTGAGDAYAGGIMGHLAAEGRLTENGIRRAMGWASVIGSFYVEGFGPDGLKQVTRTQLQKRYRDFYRMIQVP